MAEQQISKPEPEITPENKPFWEAAKRHELLLKKCPDCGGWRNPIVITANICPYCGSRKPGDWTPASGRGKVLTWVVMHRIFHPAFEPQYAIVIAELEEGPRMLGNMRGIPNDQIKAEMPIKVIYEVLNENVTLPQFAPADK